jgi:hypothetical protein
MHAQDGPEEACKDGFVSTEQLTPHLRLLAEPPSSAPHHQPHLHFSPPLLLSFTAPRYISINPGSTPSLQLPSTYSIALRHRVDQHLLSHSFSRLE